MAEPLPAEPTKARSRGGSGSAMVGVFVLYAIAIPLSPQFEFLGVPDVRPTDLIIVFVLMALAVDGIAMRARGEVPLKSMMFMVMAWDLARMLVFPAYDYGSHSMALGFFYLAKRFEYTLVFLSAYYISMLPGVVPKAVRAIVWGTIGFSYLIVNEMNNNPGHQYRASGFGSSQPNQAAIFLVGVCSLAIAWFQSKHDRGFRPICVISLVSGIIALLGTGSKEGLICLVLVGGLFSIKRKQWGVVLMAVLLGVLTWPFLPDDVRDRYSYMLTETSQTWHAVTEDPTLMPDPGESSLAGRVLAAQYITQNVLPDCFWTGQGMGARRLGSIDDFYLLEWVFNGLIGLIMYCVLLYQVWQCAREAERSGDEVLVTIAQVMSCYLLVTLLDGFVCEVYYVVRPMELFFCLLGMMCGRSAYVNMSVADRVRTRLPV